MKRIIIATIHSWNLNNAYDFIDKYNNLYDVQLIENNNTLSLEYLQEFKPDYIFFPHWSWKIEREIYENFNCIIFHTSNLPEGRGGSPIQNQIQRKIYDTYICAIKVTEKYDEGDIYLKNAFSLQNGTIDTLLNDISNIIFNQMIPEIIEENIKPKPQEGNSSYYKRRSPEMSNVLGANIRNMHDLYDFIRMLDGENYPKAYLLLGNLKVEFSQANFFNNKLIGRFEAYEK